MTKSRYSLILVAMVTALAVTISTAAVTTPAVAAAPAVLQQLDQAFVEVAQKVTPAVVNIVSGKKQMAESMNEDMEPHFKNNPFKEFFGDEFFKRFKKDFGGRGFQQRGVGSGVIVSADGTIITNAHVVRDADEIKVTMSDKRTFDAKVVGQDPESDVAVIKIDAKDLPTANFADSAKLRVGEIVVAVGNPFGFNQTVTSGIVSATGRTNIGIIRHQDQIGYEDFIQTDAAINPGNSGGPLVNINGEVIGINTAIASRSGGYQGIGFAIPSNAVKLIMDDLLKEGKVRRGLLGVNIQDVTDSLAQSFGRKTTDGALVSQVIEGSPAEKAGVKAGDIVLAFNGKPVAGAAELKNLVGREKPGAKSTLTIFRNGSTQDITVNIGERTPEALASAGPGAAPGPGATEKSDALGLEIEKVPAAMASKLGIKNGGVHVKDVKPDGAGAKMGLASGDIITEVDGKPVSDAAAFNSAVDTAKSNKIIRLKLRRGKSTLFVANPLG